MNLSQVVINGIPGVTHTSLFTRLAFCKPDQILIQRIVILNHVPETIYLI